MKPRYFHEDAVPAGGGDAMSTNTVGSGKIAGAGVGPQGAPFLNVRAQRKYKNKNREDEIDMDRELYGKLAPTPEADDETGAKGYAGGKQQSGGEEKGYRATNQAMAPKTHHGHARKIMRRLMGVE